MNTEIILKVGTLKNLVEWIGRNFVYGGKPSNDKTLYMFANKLGTDLEDDANEQYSKFYSEIEAERYLKALENTKFIIESELVDEITWTHNKGTQNEYKSVVQKWKITVTPSMNNTEDAFVAYCPKPYNPV